MGHPIEEGIVLLIPNLQRNIAIALLKFSYRHNMLYIVCLSVGVTRVCCDKTAEAEIEKVSLRGDIIVHFCMMS